MTHRRNPLGRSFLTIWIGQTVSEVGTMLSAVAGAVYIFLETGSAAWLGVISAVVAVPAILMGAAGSVIDRHPRRQVMIAADAIAALSPAIALTLALSGQLQVWHLVVAGFVASLGNAAQTAASQAAIPALVAADQLEQAHSLRQLGAGVGVVIGPIAATPILARWGIETVLVIDLATFFIGIAAVLLVRFAEPIRDPDANDDGSWRDMWSWLRGRGATVWTLMLVAGALNLSLAFFNIAVLVAVTLVAGASNTGLVLGLGGVAMILGSIASAMLGRARDRVMRIAVALGIISTGFIVAGLQPNMWMQAFGVAIALSAVPAVGASFGAIFNEQVPTQMQGRVFALRGSLGQVLQSAGALIAGVAISYLAEPAMGSSVLANSIGKIIGTQQSSGAALLLIASGMSIATIAILLVRGPLRNELREPAPTSDPSIDVVASV